MKTLIILEGCHCAGKTTLLNNFSKNYNIHKEGVKELIISEKFEEQNCNILEKNIYQLKWITDWYLKVVKGFDTHNIIICDRSPLTAVIYTDDKYYKNIYSKLMYNLFSKLEEKYFVKFYVLEHPQSYDEHKSRIIKRNNFLIDEELLNLERVRDSYDDISKYLYSTARITYISDIGDFVFEYYKVFSLTGLL